MHRHSKQLIAIIALTSDRTFSTYVYFQVCYKTNRPLVTAECSQTSTGGPVVEFSPATREARVRFPASAIFLYATILF